MMTKKNSIRSSLRPGKTPGGSKRGSTQSTREGNTLRASGQSTREGNTVRTSAQSTREENTLPEEKTQNAVVTKEEQEAEVEVIVDEATGSEKVEDIVVEEKVVEEKTAEEKVVGEQVVEEKPVEDKSVKDELIEFKKAESQKSEEKVQSRDRSQEKLAPDTVSSQHSETKSRPRSDSSENNCSEVQTNKIIPSCRKRKCRGIKKCPPDTVCVCVDPCCSYPVVPTAVVDNVKLRQENKALRSCIKRVRECAMSEACDVIKGVMDCKCCCCKARKKLRCCKSGTSLSCRETWLCVPMAGSSRCGGYTPSGWGKLMKKCCQLTNDPCGPCDVSGYISPCVNLRYKCLQKPCPCPPCPHLCPARSLPSGLRPYTPCCPLYFPKTVCGTATRTVTATSYNCSGPAHVSAGCCKPSAITAPPYRPKYTTTCDTRPQLSASAPGMLPRIDAILKEDAARTNGIYSPTRGTLSR